MDAKGVKIIKAIVASIIAGLELLIVAIVFFVTVRYIEDVLWNTLGINVIENPEFFKIYSAIQGVIGLGVGMAVGMRIKYSERFTLVNNLVGSWRLVVCGGMALGVGLSGIHHLLLLLATEALVRGWN